jgi:Mrp family chromosome partitioning ATPase
VRDVIMDPLSLAGEPYRLMQAKLALMQKERGIKTILITSAVPNEGKTFSACCLAGMLARQRDKKVLLIDADLRTGSASRMLGLNGKLSGLQELLDGNASLGLMQSSSEDNEDTFLMDAFRLEQSVLKCAEVNLYFLPSGTTPDAPSQLYNLPELERLIRQAEALFDWVIIDSSPVLALADANLLAPICDATLFVVRSRKTNAALVKEAIQRIGPERICGLLVNRVGGTSSNAYYSYYNQHSSLRLKA